MKETKKLNNVTEMGFDDSSSGKISYYAEAEKAMKSLALSHTRMEQQLYERMFMETRKVMTQVASFSTRHLMIQTGINNSSSLRRALNGLINKMSIERQNPMGVARSTTSVYVIYSPGEIHARRRKAGFNPFPKDSKSGETASSSAQEAIERLVQRHNLSRRQAQVALKCTEGLSNAEIGAKLFIRQETVKFHLRNIFIKFGVRRRTELIAHLFQQELTVNQ